MSESLTCSFLALFLFVWFSQNLNMVHGSQFEDHKTTVTFQLCFVVCHSTKLQACVVALLGRWKVFYKLYDKFPYSCSLFSET